MPEKPSKRGADQFDAQSFQEQLNTIWQRGLLLEARRLPGFWLHLYTVDAFFVEVWVCQRRYDVTLLRVISNTDELTPYVDKLAIDELLDRL
jgi:hypothetical protein